jgi:pyridoxal phosphate enzyme (YggS family)
VTVAQRLAAVQERIATAAERGGRSSDDVRLVCVTKKHALETVLEAIRGGATDLGENYAQELSAKREALAAETLRWHFIGRLQRNKAKLVAGQVALIHAVDSSRLLQAIHRWAEESGAVQDVLIAVNVAEEDSKGGIAASDLAPLLMTATELSSVRCVGLMTMPPLVDDAEDNRAHFRRLREIRDEHAAAHPELTELSMGTTGDFEVAIEEGATLVRLGTAILGPRPN